MRNVVQPCGQVAEGRLAGPGLADERGRRSSRHGERDVLERPGPACVVAEPDAVERDVAGACECARIGRLDDVDRLVEVLEDPVEERERRLHVEPDAEQRSDGEEEAGLKCGERHQRRGAVDGWVDQPCASARPPNQ